MPIIKSNIDEYGLITNTISKGMGMNFISVLAEKIDNSLDAKAKNIIITIDHIKIEYDLNGDKKEIDGDVLIISDDGKGMCQKDGSIGSLISLFKINDNEQGNGIYGIGSIASDLAIGYQDNNFDDKLTLYFTKSEKSPTQDYEVIIEWFDILKDKKDKHVWSNKVSSSNIGTINQELFNKFRLNNKSGTTILNFFNDTSISNFNIKEISYFVKKTYYSYLKTGVNIVIKNNISKETEKCDQTNLIDVLSLDLLKKDISKGCYIESKIIAYYQPKLDKYGFKIDINNYSLGKTKLNFKTKTLKSIAKDQNPTSLSSNDNFDDFQNLGEYNLIISLVKSEIIDNDRLTMRNHVDKSDASEYTGLFVKRNNRILASPTRLEYNRTTQDGTHWRCCLSWNNNKKLDSLIKPQLNKSQLNFDDFNRTLYRTISLFLKDFYKPFYKDIIESKIKIENWNLNKIENIKQVKNSSTNNEIKEGTKERLIPKSNNKQVKLAISTKSEVKSKENNTNLKVRKGFNQTQEKNTLLKQRSKCKLLDVELDSIFMPFDKDHIDNDSSNNSDENLQLLSLIAHRLKTNYHESDKKEGYRIMKKDTGFFIAKMINNLSKSKYFIDYMNSNKLSFNTGHSMVTEGILDLKENKVNIDV